MLTTKRTHSNRIALTLAILIVIAFALPTLSPSASTSSEDTPTWKILWLICRNTDQKIPDSAPVKGGLTASEVEKARQLVPYFENFVESSTDNAVDVQITVEISDSPADWFRLSKDGNGKTMLSPDSQFFPKSAHGALLYDADGTSKYDSVVAFAHIDEERRGYAGVTSEFMTFIPLNSETQWGWEDGVMEHITEQSDWGDWDRARLLGRVGGIVHEQLHYLAWRFGSMHKMPNLHSGMLKADGWWKSFDEFGYAYTNAALQNDKTRDRGDFRFFAGIKGEITDARKNRYIPYSGDDLDADLGLTMWYRDYLAGTIRSEYSAAALGAPYLEDGETEFMHGIDREWWSETRKYQVVSTFIGYALIDTPIGRIPLDDYGSVPITVNGKIMLPIQAIIEVMGGYYDWNADKKKVYCSLNLHNVQFWVDRPDYYVDFTEDHEDETRRTFDTAPLLRNGCVFVPVREVFEALGCTVEWVKDGGGEGWNMVRITAPGYRSIPAR